MLPVAVGFSGSLMLSSAAIAVPLQVENQQTQTEKEDIAQRRSTSPEDSAPEEEVIPEEPEPLTWARVDFIRNRVQLVPSEQNGRRANIADILRLGDSLRTARASRAELRFNDGSLARVGERATFRFTPNTRNFQLSNGTILLLIPPGRGRSSIQTPNAVTGIQGSALFVRYIPETDTTIVGALTDNPDGPMVLFNRDGSEQQALRANEIGVVEGNQITEIYQFDGTLFWQSSGLAEGFNYLAETTGSDELDGVRQEIREAISTQGRLNGESIITNPETFKSPSTGLDADVEVDGQESEIEFEGSPAQEYETSAEPVDEQAIEVGVSNSLQPTEEEEVAVNNADQAASSSSQSVDEEDSSETESTDSSTSSETTTADGDTTGGTADSSGSEVSSGAGQVDGQSDGQSDGQVDGQSDSLTAGGSSDESVSSEGLSQGVDSSDADNSIVDGSDVDSSTVGGSSTNDSYVDGSSISGSDVEGSEVGSAGAGAGSSSAEDLNVGGLSTGDSTVDSSDMGGASVDSPDIGSAGAGSGADALNPNDIGGSVESDIGSSSDQFSDQLSGSVDNSDLGSAVNQSPIDTQTVNTQTVDAATSTIPDTTIPDTVPADTVDSSDVTVPDINDAAVSTGTDSLLDPVPDQVDKLDEIQPVHDIEMHDPEGGSPSAGVSLGGAP